MNLTKSVLKRPVTTALVVLCLIVFGISSIFSSKLELTPEMEMPMMVIFTTYPGANPDDVTELVTKPIEDEVGMLNGIKGVTSSSGESISIVLVQYEYGTDMDKAYSDLKKKMDAIGPSLPDDAKTPNIMEFNINDQASIMMAVNNDTQDNLYNYVEEKISPEFEKIASVASVDVSGGQEGYIKVELIPEKLNQYHLNMEAISSSISAANFTYPAGDTIVGGQQLSVSTGVDYDTMEDLKKIPITVGKGDVVYLEDIAHIYSTVKDAAGIGRYDGKDTVILSIKKQQKNSAVEVSKSVNRTIEQLKRSDPGLELVVVSDMSDDITSSLESVAQTMIMAVIVSMIIIFLFFGDMKASLIVGTSIPVSILAALVLMQLMGFSLNVITLSSLVLGVGMMVDNSIVVLESCFRSTKGKGFAEYRDAALEGSGIVIQSIIGSTATTCVVFLPMAFLEGMTGQMFKPLGFTIVFCMIASLISAMTLVPLCYTMYRPREKNAPMSGMVNKMQSGYRSIMQKILPKRKTVMFATIGLLILSFLMASQLKSELMPTSDQGTISVSVETRPGLTVENADKILQKVESYVSQDEDLDSYILSYGSSGLSMGGSSASLTAYLKDDRSMETADVLKKWKGYLTTLPDCTITLTQNSMMSSMSSNAETFDFILQSTQYDDLKAASDQIVNELITRKEVTKVHSTLENSAPIVKISVDPVKAAAEGLVPVQLASTVNSMLSGKEATTLDVNGQEISVMVEFPKDEYDTIDKLQGIVLSTAGGGSVALTDVADIGFKDSPMRISRKDKQYQVTIDGEFTEFANDDTKTLLYNEVVSKHLSDTVGTQKNTIDESMAEEFGNLFKAIAIAIFLVFVVMAAQFESPKFSFMVMTTIPFSLIGSFGLLFLADATISMPSLLGFLMLVGTVVNNGILYVDTANQYRQEMDMKTALIEAGATRLRPILMTTLTTIVAMIPMALGYGDSGEMMQGLALVDVGGLIASTVLSLTMLPVYYTLMNRRKKPEPDYD